METALSLILLFRIWREATSSHPATPNREQHIEAMLGVGCIVQFGIHQHLETDGRDDRGRVVTFRKSGDMDGRSRVRLLREDCTRPPRCCLPYLCKRRKLGPPAPLGGRDGCPRKRHRLGFVVLPFTMTFSNRRILTPEGRKLIVSERHP